MFDIALDLDECLPELNVVCGSNASCIDRDGHYLCVCDAGYVKDEQALLCIGTSHIN